MHTQVVHARGVADTTGLGTTIEPTSANRWLAPCDTVKEGQARYSNGTSMSCKRHWVALNAAWQGAPLSPCAHRRTRSTQFPSACGFTNSQLVSLHRAASRIRPTAPSVTPRPPSARDSDGSRPECLYICLPDYPQAPGEGNAGGGAGGKQVHFLPEAPSQETPHAGALPPANSKLPQGVLAEAPTKNPDGVLAEAHSKHSVATSYGSIDCIPGHISKGLTMNAYSLLYVYLLHTTLLQQQEQEQLEQQRQQQGGRTASGKRLKPPQRRRLFPWYNWIFLPAGLFMQARARA